MGCISHGWVGSAPGPNQAITPPGWVPMTSTRLPVPNRSAYCGVSLQALLAMTCGFQCSSLPAGFSYQWQGAPGKPMTTRSGQPSPLRSSAQLAKQLL